MNAGGDPTVAVSELDPRLLAAYRQTRYEVHEGAGFVLEVNRYSAELQGLHGRHGVSSSAFITACNPRSEPTDASANAFRQSALLSEITRRSLQCLPGLGLHPTNGWEGEPSFLVLGLSCEAAKTLGRRFGQNAILWSGEDAVPRLVVLR
ncbi:MAG: hypothetical protein RLZZ200_939 [Pseudomonadota bacterium]|jgi:hypothetical protein